jgi:alpha-galactosidase
MSKEEFKEIRSQIEFYKANRSFMQYGRFWRKSSFDDGDVLSWTISSKDGSEAMSLLMQGLAVPNTHQNVLYPSGLNEDVKYHIENRALSYDVRIMGGLINTATPFHVRPGGFIHSVIAKFMRMNYEKESHEMYGDAMMYAGVHIKPKFAALGMNENTRLFPDFGSRIYKIREAG